MHDVVNVTRANFFRKFRTSNSTDASFPSKIPTTTQPSGTGVWDFTSGKTSPNGILIPSSIIVLPYNIGANNTTFKIRMIGWRSIYSATATTLWVPQILCEFTCTASAAVGIASAAVLDTERFSDTLTANAFNPSGGVEAVSTANDTPAHFIVDIKGCPIIEATFDMNSSATSANALWAGV